MNFRASTLPTDVLLSHAAQGQTPLPINQGGTDADASLFLLKKSHWHFLEFQRPRKA